MSWLVGYGCAVDAESQAWQTMAEGYRDPGWTIHELADLRDPKALGRTPPGLAGEILPTRPAGAATGMVELRRPAGDA